MTRRMRGCLPRVYLEDQCQRFLGIIASIGEAKKVGCRHEEKTSTPASYETDGRKFSLGLLEAENVSY
jgi:hypothetical protein